MLKGWHVQVGSLHTTSNRRPSSQHCQTLLYSSVTLRACLTLAVKQVSATQARGSFGTRLTIPFGRGSCPLPMKLSRPTGGPPEGAGLSSLTQSKVLWIWTSLSPVLYARFKIPVSARYCKYSSSRKGNPPCKVPPRLNLRQASISTLHGRSNIICGFMFCFIQLMPSPNKNTYPPRFPEHDNMHINIHTCQRRTFYKRYKSSLGLKVLRKKKKEKDRIEKH